MRPQQLCQELASVAICPLSGLATTSQHCLSSRRRLPLQPSHQQSHSSQRTLWRMSHGVSLPLRLLLAHHTVSAVVPPHLNGTCGECRADCPVKNVMFTKAEFDGKPGFLRPLLGVAGIGTAWPSTASSGRSWGLRWPSYQPMPHWSLHMHVHPSRCIVCV